MTEQEKDLYFKEIFKRNYEKLFLYALYIVGNDEDARDIVSDVFRKLLENLPVVMLSQVDSWLFITTKSRCIDMIRHRKHVSEFAKYYLESNDVNASTLSSYDERLDAIIEVISTLPEKTRSVMELCYLENLTYKEAGDMLGLKPSGVKKHILKGLQAIRERFNVSYKKGQEPKV